MIARRPRPTVAERHAVQVERAHAADLARQLADAHETIRNLGAKADRYVGRNRELVAEVLNLKAAARIEGPAMSVDDPGRFSLYLGNANGTVYLAKPAGVWDPATYEGREAVYYEDEDRPADAVPLYRLTSVHEDYTPLIMLYIPGEAAKFFDSLADFVLHVKSHYIDAPAVASQSEERSA